jgi:cytochrome c oxidase subunit 2
MTRLRCAGIGLPTGTEGACALYEVRDDVKGGIPMPGRAMISFAVAGIATVLLATLVIVLARPSSASGPSQAEQGKALFLAKGCATCHQHAAVQTDYRVAIGPDLTHYSNSPEFLRRWLADPQSVRPQTAPAYGPSGVMPNLHLSPDEIEALIAFLNSDAGNKPA